VLRIRFGIAMNTDQTLEEARPAILGDARAHRMGNVLHTPRSFPRRYRCAFSGAFSRNSFARCLASYGKQTDENDSSHTSEKIVFDGKAVLW